MRGAGGLRRVDIGNGIGQNALAHILCVHACIDLRHEPAHVVDPNLHGTNRSEQDTGSQPMTLEELT